MEFIAEKLTKYIVEKNIAFNEDYEIYKYGFQVGLEILFFMVTIIFVAMKKGMFWECVLFFGVFVPLRSLVGGFHMKSYCSCYFMSCMVTWCALYFIKNHPFNANLSLAIALCNCFLIGFIKPTKNKNRPVDRKESKKFSIKSRMILIIISIFSILFNIIELETCLNTISITLSVILFSMWLEKARQFLRASV